MTRLSLTLAVIALAGFAATGRGLAAEPYVVSSDATARFVALGVSKSIVIDFPADIKEVLVADKGIANAVVPTKRRVYIIGQALGQTNVFVFGADGRQIGALDIAVTATSLPAALENYPSPANVILVYRAARVQTLGCTPIMCIDANKPGSDQPPDTQNINVTGNPSAVAVVPK